MNTTLQDFLAARLPFQGLAAMGVVAKNSALATESYCDWLPASHAGAVIVQLSQAASTLPAHQIQPVRLCWTFELMRIHLALRPDGACLALFVENGPGTAAPALESALADFTAADFEPELK